MDGFVPYRCLATPPEKAARAEIILELIRAFEPVNPNLKADVIAIVTECRDEHRRNARSAEAINTLPS